MTQFIMLLKCTLKIGECFGECLRNLGSFWRVTVLADEPPVYVETIGADIK